MSRADRKVQDLCLGATDRKNGEVLVSESSLFWFLWKGGVQLLSGTLGHSQDCEDKEEGLASCVTFHSSFLSRERPLFSVALLLDCFISG